MPKLSPVKWTALKKIFELDGWEHDRTKGDHYVMVKDAFKRPVVIPMKQDVAVFIIRNNLKTAKMTRKRYFELKSKS